MNEIPNQKQYLTPAGQAHYIEQATVLSTHPCVTKDFHPAYDAALVLVGERHAKHDLVNLVGHLLVKLAEAKSASNSDEVLVRRNLIDDLTQWTSCMSYNDSYFGEPAGHLKRTVMQIEREVDAITFQSAGEQAGHASQR